MAPEQFGTILQQMQAHQQPRLDFDPKKERRLRDYLEGKYGLGDDPRKRKILYNRIVMAFANNPDFTLALIEESELMALMIDEAKRSHYFCRAMALKIRENAVILKLVSADAATRFRPT